jgi:four helix bundle protein
MEKTTIFENLKCWQASRKLLMMVNSVSNAGKLSNEFFLKNHIKRKAVLAMTMIAEGFDKASSTAFISHLNSSQLSIAELKCFLTLFADQDLLVAHHSHDLVHQTANETNSCTVDLIAYLQSNNT